MIIKIKYILEEPLVNLQGEDVRETIPGLSLRAAITNHFLLKSCPYSSTWCKKENCKDAGRCFVPTELLGGKTSFSFGFPECPNCSKERLIPIPRSWLRCKKCMRSDKKKEDLIKTNLGSGASACPSCGSRVSLKHFGTYYCQGCGHVEDEYPLISMIVNVGLDQKTTSSKESILYDYGAIVPGYTFYQFMSTEDQKLVEFLKDSVGERIFLGGKRSRGFGACKILSVEEFTHDSSSESSELYFITPAITDKETIGGIPRSSVEESNGVFEFIGHFEANRPGQGKISDRNPVAAAGSVVKLGEAINISVEDSLLSYSGSNKDGYNAVIPLLSKSEEK